MMSLASNLSVTLASARMRLTSITRYPGQLLLECIIPVIFAYLPILFGRASAGPQAASIFARNTGTPDYIAYMLVGSSVFTIVSLAFWHVAYWIRWEQESGTLESIYLAPTHRIWVAAGTALYSCLRSIGVSLVGYIGGCLILGAQPFPGQFALAGLFLLVGLIPLYSLTLLFGALILKVKEANALVNLMQWVVTFLMGIFFPVALFPPVLKAIALLFPPTWITNGVRSALLGVGYFFGAWYFDMAVLWAFLLVTPLIGYWVFSKTENSIRRNEGVGTF